jgi:cytochrome P450
MNPKSEERSRPAWSDDHLESPSPAEIRVPYFDNKLGAWVLSRYADVLAAFRSPNLIPTSTTSRGNATEHDEAAWLKMRAETKAAFSLRQLNKWQKILSPEVCSFARGLPTDRAVDLVEEFARPLCLVLAVVVTGADEHNAKQLEKLAGHVSAAAADPYDSKIRADAKCAKDQLRTCFHKGPKNLRDSGFIALSHTVPSLLANTWFALLQHPEQWKQLHQQPDLTPQATEELLRYAGLTRLIFRQAIGEVNLNGTHIRKGDRIILRITTANKDSHRFLNPCRLDFTHRGSGQLAFGAGPHACVGANLIRMAAITITRPLVERFACAELVGPVEWRGGPIFRTPVSLPVRLQEKTS